MIISLMQSKTIPWYFWRVRACCLTASMVFLVGVSVVRANTNRLRISAGSSVGAPDPPSPPPSMTFKGSQRERKGKGREGKEREGKGKEGEGKKRKSPRQERPSVGQHFWVSPPGFALKRSRRSRCRRRRRSSRCRSRRRMSGEENGLEHNFYSVSHSLQGSWKDVEYLDSAGFCPYSQGSCSRKIVLLVLFRTLGFLIGFSFLHGNRFFIFPSSFFPYPALFPPPMLPRLQLASWLLLLLIMADFLGL